MKRDVLRARARVERVIAAGRRVQDPADLLGQEARTRLLETSGLSAEGVALALTQHLETQPSDENLETLLRQTGDAPQTHVVLSANVCTAALRGLALAVATSPVVFVRPSRRDPVLAEILIRALAEDSSRSCSSGTVELTETIKPAPHDEVHLYGADASLNAIEESLPAGVVVRGHGTGLGLALVSAEVSLKDAAISLADDVVAFDQRGCLSPRFVVVEGDVCRAEHFAAELDLALLAAAATVPRGVVDAALAAEISLYGASMQAIGSFVARPSHAIGVDLNPRPRALLLAPAGRVVHVVSATTDEALRLLASFHQFVTVLGVSDASPFCEAVARSLPFARLVPLGFMQRPPLDGPVDRRPTSAPRLLLSGSGSGRSS